MMVRACDKCNAAIVFLKTDKLKPDGSIKWMPCEAASVKPEDLMYDYKRHQAHWKKCPAAAEFRQKYEEDKRAKQTAKPDTEIEF